MSVLRWGLTGAAAVVAGLLILVGGFGVTQAGVTKLLRIDGQLVDAQPKLSATEYFVHLRGNAYCFRVFPDDFSPAPPKLDAYVGHGISVYVDQAVYPDSGGPIGDPFCNFQVIEMSLPTSAGETTTYVTNATSAQAAFGHTRDGYVSIVIQGIVLAVVTLAINLGIHFRRRRRRKGAVA